MVTIIRNPEAYQARQQERQLAFEKKVHIAKQHLIPTLSSHYEGALETDTLDKALDSLIVSGALGAMKSFRRIADTLKEHQRRPGSRLSKDDRHRRQYAVMVLDRALDELEADGKVEVLVSRRRATIRAIEITKTDDSSFYDEFVDVAMAAEIAVIDTYISPRTTLVGIDDTYARYVEARQPGLLSYLPGSTKANLRRDWDWSEMMAA